MPGTKFKNVPVNSVDKWDGNWFYSKFAYIDVSNEEGRDSIFTIFRIVKYYDSISFSVFPVASVFNSCFSIGSRIIEINKVLTFGFPPKKSRTSIYNQQLSMEIAVILLTIILL